jgi:hypothetical protein
MSGAIADTTWQTCLVRIQSLNLPIPPSNAMTTERFLQRPPLENGDRLTRAEFERRYAAMPHLKKAELIERVVYVGSPVRVIHSQPHAAIMTWLGVYSAATRNAIAILFFTMKPRAN